MKRNKRRRKRKKEQALARILTGIVVIGILLPGFLIWKEKNRSAVVQSEPADMDNRPPLDVELLTVNPYSRPGTALGQVNGIVIHYTANPGTGAIQNRDYFESLKDLDTEKISSNFVIGLEGEIIQCVPTSEMAYASNSRNQDTVSIENCHPDETGKFNDSTYNSLVHLTAYLCDKFDLDPENGGVIRHYDVTGKDCPRYFVQNPDAWQQFLADVADYMREYGAL